MLRPFLLLIILSLAACDYGSDGLVLTGTYRGTGQSNVTMGVASVPTTVAVTATFDDATIGALRTEVTADVTIGGTTEAYAGPLQGTLAADGAISFSGTLSGAGSGTLAFTASGEATETRIEVDVTGSLPVSNLVLTR